MRRQGRTAQQLLGLPDGAVFLVHSDQFRRYCLDLLEALGRRRDAVRIVTSAEAARSQLAGLPRQTAWAVDHAFGGLVDRDGWKATVRLREQFGEPRS